LFSDETRRNLFKHLLREAIGFKYFDGSFVKDRLFLKEFAFRARRGTKMRAFAEVELHWDMLPGWLSVNEQTASGQGITMDRLCSGTNISSSAIQFCRFLFRSRSSFRIELTTRRRGGVNLSIVDI
jgi:hypothetical protein